MRPGSRAKLRNLRLTDSHRPQAVPAEHEPESISNPQRRIQSATIGRPQSRSLAHRPDPAAGRCHDYAQEVWQLPSNTADRAGHSASHAEIRGNRREAVNSEENGRGEPIAWRFDRDADPQCVTAVSGTFSAGSRLPSLRSTSAHPAIRTHRWPCISWRVREFDPDALRSSSEFPHR